MEGCGMSKIGQCSLISEVEFLTWSLSVTFVVHPIYKELNRRVIKRIWKRVKDGIWRRFQWLTLIKELIFKNKRLCFKKSLIYIVFSKMTRSRLHFKWKKGFKDFNFYQLSPFRQKPLLPNNFFQYAF